MVPLLQEVQSLSNPRSSILAHFTKDFYVASANNQGPEDILALFFGNFPGDFLTLFSHKIFSSPHILTPVLARCAPSPTRHRHRHGHRRHHGAPHLHRRHQDAGLRRHQDAPWPAGALVPPPHPPLSSSASLSPPDPLRLPPGLLPPPLPLGPGDVGGGGEVFAKLKLGRVQVSKIVNETGLSISPSLFWQNA